MEIIKLQKFPNKSLKTFHLIKVSEGYFKGIIMLKTILTKMLKFQFGNKDSDR